LAIYEHVYFAKNGRETDRKTDRKKQSTSANYRLTTTHNAQMTIRTEAEPPKKSNRLKKE